jgi:hypothetical protein
VVSTVILVDVFSLDNLLDVLTMVVVIGYLGLLLLVDWNSLPGCKGLFALVGVIGHSGLICVVQMTGMIVWLVWLCRNRLGPEPRRDVALHLVQKHKASRASCALHAVFMLLLFFYPTGGSDMFPRNVG